ncbi:aldo/keto reductase [Promicromonospora sp. Populi]|uniref:aldo/keto reductase n=1 Tax=Promicromonospora sp. Populi TaxID=3239420 RepID=UPI0034E2923E
MTSLTDFVTLGRSGLRISPATLGTMTFGEDTGWGASVAESEAMLDRYVEAGGNSIDTANIYTNGHSEKIVGDWLAARSVERDRLVLGTKFFANLHTGDPNGGGASRKAILHQLDDSLRRLGTDYVDIYWLHNFDPVTPREETLSTLDDLVTAGKVRYIGFSDVPAWATAAAAVTTAFRDWPPIIALQLEYSLLERTSEGELFPLAHEFGMGVLPWSPLKSGWLSGKYRRGEVAQGGGSRASLVGLPGPADYDVIERVVEVAEELGLTPAEVSLAWVRSKPGVTSTLLGARRMSQLEANLRSLAVELPADALLRLDEVSNPHLNFPAENNALLAPTLHYNGATVDGVAHHRFGELDKSPTRY